MALLQEAHQYIGTQAHTGYDISPAAEWLLDNFHTIEAQYKEIHEGLPRSFFRTLPMLTDAPLAGLPRIYGVAWAFVAHTDSAFNEEMLIQFLVAYQETRELRLCEVWALPTTLRVVLVENLRRLAERVATNKAAREVANMCFDRIESYDRDALDQLLALLVQRGAGDIFLSQMAQRMHDRRTTGDDSNQVLIRSWLDVKVPELGAIHAQCNVDQAADNLSVSNAVTSLRAIGDADWTDLIGQSSALMRLLLTNPLFAAEDTATRDQTLHTIEDLSKRSKLSELGVAHAMLGLMSNADATESCVGHYWLHGQGQSKLRLALGLHGLKYVALQSLGQKAILPLYLLALAAGMSILMWLALPRAFAQQTPLWIMAVCVLSMLFPASEAAVALVNRLISESRQPQHLPRLAFVDGIPPEHRVMVVIPCILASTHGIQELVKRLELHYLANPERQAQFALLSDWADSSSLHAAHDTTHLNLAVQLISELNTRYPPQAGEALAAQRFIVLHRERQFGTSEQCWMGWERKRGKLEQLVTALATNIHAPFLPLGAASEIAPGMRYIVTLDSDTQLPPGRLRELVGVAAHPHNQPQLNALGTAVLHGYAILQPRIVTPLPAAHQSTWYHWLFSGKCGIDPYSAASSEIYQDVFSEGSFTGKGLFHVQAVHAVLCGRLPENLILSHDLLDGSIARCAVVTDVTLIEEAPFHADVAASRAHRWIRGDWQLLPLLGKSIVHPQTLPIGKVNLWKMVDNLRRSLVAPMSLVLLILSLAVPGISPWPALALVVGAFLAGPLMGAVAGLSPHRNNVAKWHFINEAGVDTLRAICGGLWQVAQLVQQSILATDAIARAVYRTFISHRQLLQWTTAATAQSQAQTALPALVRLHWREPVAALLVLGALLWLNTPYPMLSGVLCLLWAGSPVWTWWASRANAPQQALAATDASYLEGIARDAWRLFERCVTAQENHLPPDNLQSTPTDMVAHRTSPTNIGLYLLSVACAREFGWIGTHDMLSRLQSTLSTLQRLERHRGHFLNWYDTQTMAPLLPAYVSTVDSGNLSGHLLTVAQACLELALAPLASDTSKHALAAAHDRAATLARRRSSLSRRQRHELQWALADHRATRRSADMDLAGTHQNSALASEKLRALAQAFTQLAWEADFSFVYNAKRHLFHIGYRVAERQQDAGFYDLLASESRLTSILAVAKGDISVRHWASLGRPFFALGTHVGLRSWTGSMFEYLMPGLVLEEPIGSVLHEACKSAVREQIAYAEGLGVPWGISESAYAANDDTLAYQYAPQGVPRLALRRTPMDELVIAPYATALAAMLEPQKAIANFRALEALGARGRYGFNEALDYTPARRLGNAPFSLVETAMAHHQGMSIVSLANVLLQGVAQRWGMANAPLQSVASLLHERVPREVSLLDSPTIDNKPLVRQRRRAPGMLREVVPGIAAIEPTHLLSNGRYTVTLRSNGAGYSQWGSTCLTRHRDDALRDEYGSFFFIRRPHHTYPVSLTQHPAPDPLGMYRSVYHADRVCLDATWPDLESQITVWVSPEDDVELRSVELRNLGDDDMQMELMSCFEVTLAASRADEGHPAFSNMFVQAAWSAEHQALLFDRQPRLQTENRVQAAHFLATSDPRVIEIRAQTDRQRWRGRNRSASQMLAESDALPVSSHSPGNLLTTGLDPMCALVTRIRIAAKTSIVLTFASAISDNAATLHAMIDKYRQSNNVTRASLMSATLTGIRLRALRIRGENFAAMQPLSTALVFSLTRPQQPTSSSAVHPQTSDRRLLWRFGISGDRPLILVSAGVPEGLGLLRSMAHALHLWSWSGMACDLVVVNSEPQSYAQALHREIAALKERHANDMRGRSTPPTTTFHLLKADELLPDELNALKLNACLRFQADGRPLTHHVQDWLNQHAQAAQERDAGSVAVIALGMAADTTAVAPLGHFYGDGREFGFSINANQRPMRPWVNVLSNPQFGAQVSECGSGNTWAINSRLNQLTAWKNDPVSDPPSEWFLLQDCKTMQTWSITANPWLADHAIFEVRHGQGYTTMRHKNGNLAVQLTWCVDAVSAVKQIQVSLTNYGHKLQSLRLIGMVEWMMGANRSDRSTVLTACRSAALGSTRQPVLLCTQREISAGFGAGTAFFCMVGQGMEPTDWTCDRREFFDVHGSPVVPDHWGQRAGVGQDPCGALSARWSLAPGETAERVFLLGYGANPDAALVAAARAADTLPGKRLEAVKARWDAILGATVVKTPDPLLDAMVNRWLLYQTITCRMWAKAGFYQAGGATGFRDQLQDAMALAWAAPKVLRDQIVLGASRQFVQGDVQHWWHAPLGAGVRTHFSDDLLWLPLACAHYLRATDDVTILDQRVPFLDGPQIPPGDEDAYFIPTVSAQDATVFEHAALAIDRSLRVGVHGLPLMGSGDWNDGMNRVGIGGQGESVWLGWFLCHLVDVFAPWAHTRGETVRATAWEAAATGWKTALRDNAWDGQWFKRAYFDDGQALGAHGNPEAHIDLIAQAWSVLSHAGPLPLQRIAMASVDALLVDPANGFIKLLDPPLRNAVPSAGYIQAYPPGVRENGGQYSHAGVWAVMALAELATIEGTNATAGDDVYRYFTYLSPAHRAAHPTRGPQYGIEPYVMAGDVYTQPPYIGKGGWSWYTGAAAWMHRAAVESLFGLQINAQTLVFHPCLPAQWQHTEITLRREAKTMRFILMAAQPAAASAAIAATADYADAVVLLPGQALPWPTLRDTTTFVIPLLHG